MKPDTKNFIVKKASQSCCFFVCATLKDKNCSALVNIAQHFDRPMSLVSLIEMMLSIKDSLSQTLLLWLHYGSLEVC